jgi:hypothetical protein
VCRQQRKKQKTAKPLTTGTTIRLMQDHRLIHQDIELTEELVNIFE